MKLFYWVVSVLFVCFFSVEASANGVISGRLSYVNDSSGWCPAGNACTGWKFLQSQTTRPDGDGVRFTKLVLRNSAGTVIGQSSTGGSGNYTLSWTGASSLSNCRLEWWGEDSTRMFILESSEAPYFILIPTLNNNTTAASPQPVGGIWTRLDGANAANNASDMVTAFLGSAILSNDVHGVRLRTNSSTCASGCARWYEASKEGRIYLPANGGFDRLARVLHEFGHIATYNGSRDRTISWETDSTNGFAYDRDGSDWTNTSREYFGTAAQEALATALGARGNYSPNATAPEPTQCGATGGSCPVNSGTRMETEPTCGLDFNRQHQNIVRWFWDLMDTSADTCGAATSDNTALSIGAMIDMLRRFPNGRGNHQKSEQVCCVTFLFTFECSTCDSEVGRNVFDYHQHMPAGTQDLRSCNCVN